MQEQEPIFRDLTCDEIEQANVILTGIPFDKNASVGKGASEAPSRLRDLSRYLPAVSMDGDILANIRLFDNGDIEECKDYFDVVQEKVLSSMRLGKFNLFFGGDHSVAIPLERAFYDYALEKGKIPAIIHIDAHPDICDVYDGSSYSHACPNRRAIDYGYKTKDVTLIGMRGYEAQEVKYFAEHPEIDVYNASYINEFGIEKMLNHIQEKYDDRYMIYLSYDIDANDPSFAPGTGTPEAFGLNSQTTLKIITTIIKKLNVQAMDFVEISPRLDCNDITSWLGLKTLYEVFKVLKVK